jgi:hypothetical protein
VNTQQRDGVQNMALALLTDVPVHCA